MHRPHLTQMRIHKGPGLSSLGVPGAPQILADQLTKGGKLCPPNNTGTPRIFRPSDGPEDIITYASFFETDFM